MEHGPASADLSVAVSDLLDKSEKHFKRSYYIGNDAWGATITTDFEDDVLSQFLAPNYFVKYAASTSIDIHLYTDYELFSDALHIWEKLAEHSPEHSPSDEGGIEVQSIALAKDIKMVDGQYPLRPSASRIITLISGSARHAFFLGEQRASRLDVARAARALLASRATLSGAIAVHGACFAIGDRAYLICGAKHSGKTTNLFAALQNIPGVRFISNDRTYVQQRGSALVVRGSPHSIPVRLSTLVRFPELVTYLSRDGAVMSGISRGYADPVDLRADDAQPRERESRETFLSSRELVEAFKIEELTEGVLAGVVILEPRLKAGRPGWIKRTRQPLPSAISDNLHTRIETNFSYWDSVFDERSSNSVLPDFTDVDLWELNSWHDLSEAWRKHPL